MTKIDPKATYTHRTFKGIWKILKDGQWYFIETPTNDAWKRVCYIWRDKDFITEEDYPWFIKLCD